MYLVKYILQKQSIKFEVLFGNLNPRIPRKEAYFNIVLIVSTIARKHKHFIIVVRGICRCGLDIFEEFYSHNIYANRLTHTITTIIKTK